jgi:hypothetical protein
LIPQTFNGKELISAAGKPSTAQHKVQYRILPTLIWLIEAWTPSNANFERKILIEA